jgi:hypothetical protein
MARLSIEHYRTNGAMTPDHFRKPGRILGIFKSRSSLSLPTSNTANDSLPGPVSSSPLDSTASPTVKSGFEKVGILPSERKSLSEAQKQLENNGGNHVAQVLEMYEKNLKIVGVPYNLGAAVDDESVQPVGEAAYKETEKWQNKETGTTVDAVKSMLLKHEAENKGSKANAESTNPMHGLSLLENVTELRVTSSRVSENGKTLFVLECARELTLVC